MVENHGPVAAADKEVGLVGGGDGGAEVGGFEDACDVVVALGDAVLAGGEMAVDEAEGGVVEGEARDDGAFVAVEAAQAALYHRARDVVDVGLFRDFGKDAGKETDHVGRVEEVVLRLGNVPLDGLGEVVLPEAVDAAHVLLLVGGALALALFALALEESLCRELLVFEID